MSLDLILHIVATDDRLSLPLHVMKTSCTFNSDSDSLITIHTLHTRSVHKDIQNILPLLLYEDLYLMLHH